MKKYILFFLLISCASEESRLADIYYQNKNYNKVYILSIATLFISGCFILFSDTYFNGSNNIFINSIFTNIVKLFVIGISIAILYVSHGYIKNNKLNLFEYPILLLFSVLGMLVMLSSNTSVIPEAKQLRIIALQA